MKFDLSEIAKENPSNATYTYVAKWLIENTPVGGVSVVSSVIGIDGVEVGPKHIRPFIAQKVTGGQKIVTRFIAGSLHVWRIA